MVDLHAAIARGWRAVAAVEHAVDTGYPQDPTPRFLAARGSAEWGALHDELREYWAPFLHLLYYGLGWSRPDVGLLRWLEAGLPDEHSVLAVIREWYGPDRVQDFLRFSFRESTVRMVSAEIAGGRGVAPPVLDAPLDLSFAPEPARSDVWVGGSDPLHQVGASREPCLDPPAGRAEVWSVARNRRIVEFNSYPGWYARLDGSGHAREGGESVHVELVCRSTGWLGEFRKSTVTGIWFRGQHRWHQLGN